MGSATAWSLARLGHEVVVLERFEQGHAMGSSHGRARIFRFAYPSRAYVQLAQRSLGGWAELEDETGARVLEISGGLDHGDAASVDAVAAALVGAGATIERLTPDEAGERWPDMRFEGHVVHSRDG